jgi:hypothetical protein
MVPQQSVFRRRLVHAHVKAAILIARDASYERKGST